MPNCQRKYTSLPKSANNWNEIEEHLNLVYFNLLVVLNKLIKMLMVRYFENGSVVLLFFLIFLGSNSDLQSVDCRQ